MKNIGVDGLVSSKDFANSIVRFSTYFGPNFSSIKSLENLLIKIDASLDNCFKLF